jgi:prepilin-type processing-associated H-X9-DG protein
MVIYGIACLPELYDGGANYGYVDGYAKWLAKGTVWGSQDFKKIQYIMDSNKKR